MSSSTDTGCLPSSWLAPLFDCISPREEASQRYSRRIGEKLPALSLSTKHVLTAPGSERQMQICHNQPHLVPPMKLVFYDEDMPYTPVKATHSPPASQISQLVAQGRNLATKASERASLSVRKKPSSRPRISAPLPPPQPVEELPFRRRQNYRPLELSIYYVPENRLSDLPEFEGADFNIFGELQLPPKALLHSRSVEHLGSSPSGSLKRKPATSMVGERQLEYWQRSRSSSVISTSRPPSAHDTFHSHPVAFNALPGFTPAALSRQPTLANSLTVLSPMQEEFTPTSEAYVDTIEFPRIDEEVQHADSAAAELASSALKAPEPVLLEEPSEIQTPFKLSRPPTSYSYRSRARSQPHSNSFNRNRVSQWISRSASTAIPSPRSHAFQKSQFYQCMASPPQPVHHHDRDFSTSTVATSILSGVESVVSLTSVTTAPTTVQGLASRSNTVKSYGKPVVVVEEEELPPSYAEMGDFLHGKVETTKVPGIGMAF